MGPIHVIEELPAEDGRGRSRRPSRQRVVGGRADRMPWPGAYSASKFGLRGVSEVLRFDLARRRIAVSSCARAASTRHDETVQGPPALTRTARRSVRCRPGSGGAPCRPRKAATAIVRRHARAPLSRVYTSRRHPASFMRIQRYIPPLYVVPDAGSPTAALMYWPLVPAPRRSRRWGPRGEPAPNLARRPARHQSARVARHRLTSAASKRVPRPLTLFLTLGPAPQTVPRMAALCRAC